MTSKSWVSAGVQAGVPGYSVNLLLFTYWYFSSGHLRFTGRWCPNLNLAKISLSLSRLKSTHAHGYVTEKVSGQKPSSIQSLMQILNPPTSAKPVITKLHTSMSAESM